MARERGRGISRRGLLAASAAAAVVPRLHLRLPVRASPVPVAPDLSIWPRDAWAPGPPKGALAAEEVRFLLVHHTAANTDHRADEVPGILAAMYQFHTGDKGWPDIAYNFLVDREGGVWEGRSGSLAGPVAADATGGNQGFDQLVCFIGDFTSVTPTPAALDAGTRTLAWLAWRYRIDTSAGAKVTFVSRGSNKWPVGTKVTTSTVAGHRDMSTTACPGDAFYPYVRNQMQGAVQELRGGAVLAPPPSTSPATVAPTAAATTQAPTTTETTATTQSPATTEATTTTAATSTTGATTTGATTTIGPATTSRASSTTAAAGGDAAAPNQGEGDGGVPAAVPIAAATVAAGGALVWLRRRAQRTDEPSEDDAS